eukprot:15290617-Ditylum_brightwellii.AAC.1
MQDFLKTFDHQTVRCAWLQTARAVNPSIKKFLKQYVGHLPFPHNLVMREGGIEPANQAHIEVCSLFHCLSALMVEGDRSNSCTAELLKNI